MRGQFDYPCPGCDTTNAIHGEDCDFTDRDIEEIRKAYIDIISVLSAENAKRQAMQAPPGISFSTLSNKVDDMLETGLFKQLHVACLHRLKNDRRVAEEDEMGGLYLREPEEREQELVPNFDPLRTIYEYGPVDGAKDYAVYTMVSWCELIGLDWENTKRFLTDWLESTNAWADLSWGESSIDELLENKRHIHERGLGWGDMAQIAANEIEESGRPKQIDADAKLEELDRDEYITETE